MILTSYPRIGKTEKHKKRTKYQPIFCPTDKSRELSIFNLAFKINTVKLSFGGSDDPLDRSASVF